jgi:hypothetical protein
VSRYRRFRSRVLSTGHTCINPTQFFRLQTFRSRFEPHATRGKNEAWGTPRLIGVYFRAIGMCQAATVGEEDGNDSDGTSRSRKNPKSFNSPYRTKNVGNWRRRFYLRTLRIRNFGKL